MDRIGILGEGAAHEPQSSEYKGLIKASDLFRPLWNCSSPAICSYSLPFPPGKYFLAWNVLCYPRKQVRASFHSGHKFSRLKK